MKKRAMIYDYARMCKATEDCSSCPLHRINNGTNFSCNMFIVKHYDKANEIILHWSKKHPIKTRQDMFLKVFPNAKMDNHGVSLCCPALVDVNFKCNAENVACAECSKKYWLAEVDE